MFKSLTAFGKKNMITSFSPAVWCYLATILNGLYFQIQEPVDMFPLTLPVDNGTTLMGQTC